MTPARPGFVSIFKTVAAAPYLPQTAFANQALVNLIFCFVCIYCASFKANEVPIGYLHELRRQRLYRAVHPRTHCADDQGRGMEPCQESVGQRMADESGNGGIRKCRGAQDSLRGYYIARIDYSYAVNGEYYSGSLERLFFWESSADRFVGSMKGQMVFVRSSPSHPERSALLKQDQPGGWAV